MKPKHFLITLLALLISITASAYEWTDANGTVWSFTTSGSNATLYNGYNTPCISGTIPSDLIIPSKVYISETDYNVTSIGENAFSGCSSLTSINIPDGVTSIGGYAFYGCSSLTSITLPDGVTSIGNSAFFGCSSLTSITLPDGVTSINSYAFYNCSNLSSINIPDGVKYIDNNAFMYCSSLTSINIPNSVKSIGSSAFSGCSSLTSINIPNSITSISGSVFFCCTSLTSISIPDGVTSIGDNAFYNCYSLTTIHFASITPRFSYVNNWSDRPTLIVPDEAVDAYKAAWTDHAAQVVSETSFAYVYNVENVTALEDASAVIEEIGEENALNVVNLKVSGTINSYDVMVFRNKMLNLRNLDLSGATIVANSYTYYNNQYKTKANVITGYFAPSTLLSFTLPTNITTIDVAAFSGCSYLTAITIPESVTSIGTAAFSGCERLQSVILPSGITSIPGSAFNTCSKLRSINLPQGVTSIGNSAFEGCYNLISVNLPKGLKSIGSSAFQGCSKLTQIKLPPYMESLGNNAFYGCSSLNDITVYIPNYSLSVNETAFASYTTATLKIPRFLYNDYYYSQGGWKRFVNMEECDLEPGDYETLPTNTDTSISNDDEIIPNISEDNPIDGEIFSEGSITVTDGVSGTQEFDTVEQNINGEGQGGSLIGEDDGETEGNLTMNTLRVKINVKAGRWYFFCFPYDVTIANCTYPGQYAWRWYDGAERAANGSGGWKAVTGSTLTAGQGYAFQTSHTGNLIVEFSHPKFGGDRPKTLVAHAAANAANASWNLVGNPYSSFYDFLATDFDSPITVYNSNGTYSAYRPADDECHLQPYEAFFVQKPTEVDAINFEAERRESYNQGQTKKAERVKARRRAGINPERRLINLEMFCGEEQADRTRVVLNEKKSRDYELDCDASKFMSSAATAQFYSIENGVQMAINERPQQGDIRLGYTAAKAGKLSISASRMDMPMVLVDTKENTTFDLSLGSYEFDTQAGTFNDRFMLRLSGEATAINNMTKKTGVCIGTQEGGIAIGGAEGKTVNVYTTGGAQTAQHDGNGFVALKRGVYVVSVDGVSAKVSVK